ncbi:hypothetical protein V1T76_27885 [Roseibium sp. FZY0029]|uniref:hypothetical protein n=1 Tax=Roseibium sp. FZY0029 TaxID=3116647 RepID=UPI002E9B966D|nr:hypothetical protein [Roseibium sp. FZY0029]
MKDETGRTHHCDMVQDILFLSRRDVQRLVSTTALLGALWEGFISYSKRTIDALRVPIPLPADRVPLDASGIVIAPGLVDAIPAYAVKVHAKFPGSNPTIQGPFILKDLNDGRPLAVLESSFLTALRTGLASAIGADALARPSPKRANCTSTNPCMGWCCDVRGNEVERVTERSSLAEHNVCAE